MSPFFSRERRERELDDEIRTHLEMAIEDRVARGEPREDAERAVRREFGDPGRVKEVTRAMWGWVWLERLAQDLVFGARSLRREPGFAVVAVLTIGLGVGATTAMFTVVNGVLFRPLPFSEPDRLMAVSVGTPRQVGEGNGMLASEVEALSQRSSPFSLMSAYHTYPPVTLTAAGDPARLAAGFVMDGFVDVLGAQPALGPGFAPGDDDYGASPTVVLGSALWHARFDSDPDVIGTSAVVNGVARTIVGVMPPGFDFPDGADLWLPWGASPFAEPGMQIMVYAIGRLNEGVTTERARAELNGWVAGLEEPEQVATATPLKDELVADSRYALLLFMGAVGVLLLISCANVANLLLMRAGSREHEIGLRRVLGAGRPRLIRQLLTESVTLALLGGGLGMLIAFGGVEALLSVAPAGTIPRDREVLIDVTVLAFALGVSSITGIAFGLVPAFKTTQGDPSGVIRDGGRTHTHRGGIARGTLVVAEVGLAVVLLTGAGLLVRSFQQVRAIELGFEPEGTLAFYVDLPRDRYTEVEPIMAVYGRVLDGLGETPGVEASGGANFEPFGPIATNTRLHIEGAEPESPGSSASVGRSIVTPGYFEAMRVPRLSGRNFDARDGAGGSPVAMINRSMAERFWPDGDPLGVRVTRSRIGGADWWMTIVGVVEDVVRREVTETREPILYMPLAQVDNEYELRHMQFVARTRSPRTVAAAMRDVLREADPDLPIGSVSSMDDLVVESIGDRLFEARILGTFAVLALLLAAVGIYGVTAYSVSERRHEIGIRVALGARADQIAGMTVGRVMMLAAPGLLLGVGGGWLATRWIESSLYGVTRSDPLTLAGVALLLAGVAIAAALVPTRRATRVDPVDVLSA